MRYTSIAFATLLSFASTPAFSQLENLFRGMEKFAEDLEKGQQAPNAPSQQQQAPQQQTEPQPQPQQQSQPQPQPQPQPQRKVEAPGVNKSTLLEQKKEFELVKKKNLANRWVVKAQAVCSRSSSCQITSIREEPRNEDGSARFMISHQTRKGTSGHVGSSYIECGFNKSNSLSSTTVNAVCQ